MDCDQALELLSQRIDERLTPEQNASLARHLAACPSCARLASLMMDVDALLSVTPAAAAPVQLSGAIMLRVHRHARLARVTRRVLVSVLSLALLVVAVVLPAMRAVQATGQGNVFALTMAQVGRQLLALLESLAQPLVTITRALVLGQSHQYVVAWLAAAVLLVVAWVSVVSRAIRPARRGINLTTTPDR